MLLATSSFNIVGVVLAFTLWLGLLVAVRQLDAPVDEEDPPADE